MIVAETRLIFSNGAVFNSRFSPSFSTWYKQAKWWLTSYVKESIPARVLTSFGTPANTQIIVFEINLRKEKWLFVGIYKSPSLNSQYFLDTLSDLPDFYSNLYDNKVILGDLTFLNEHDLINLVKIILVVKEKVHVLTWS